MPRIVVDEDSKRSIIRIIDSWRGKLTWEKLCLKVSKELEFDGVISRHTLLAYDDISLAFSTKKKSLKEAPQNKAWTGDHALEKAYARIKYLEDANKRLESQVVALQEQFVRWQFNLHRIEVDMEQIQKDVDVPLSELKRADDPEQKKKNKRSV